MHALCCKQTLVNTFTTHFYFGLKLAEVNSLTCGHSQLTPVSPPNVFTLELKSQLKREGGQQIAFNRDSHSKHFPGLQPATRNPST